MYEHSDIYEYLVMVALVLASSLLCLSGILSATTVKYYSQ